MIKYAWSGPEDDRTCGDVLDDLEAAEVGMGEWRFFNWNDENGDAYDCVAWTDPGEKFPEPFDEDAEREAFFKLLHTVIHLGV